MKRYVVPFLKWLDETWELVVALTLIVAVAFPMVMSTLLGSYLWRSSPPGPELVWILALVTTGFLFGAFRMKGLEGIGIAVVLIMIQIGLEVGWMKCGGWYIDGTPTWVYVVYGCVAVWFILLNLAVPIALKRLAELLTEGERALLRRAADAPPEGFQEVAGLDALRTALIDRLQPSQVPGERRGRDPVLTEVLNRAVAQLRGRMVQSASGVADAMQEYADDLRDAPGEVIQTLRHYSSVFAATCQGAVSRPVVNAKNLYKGFSGNGFADWEYWGHRKLRKDSRGDLLFIARPDENNPWNTPPYPHDYRLLQYYRKKKGSWSSDLKGGVNGRTRMWGTGKAIPGGVSYENLAILENFDQGQTFSYGIYNGSVKDLLDRKKPPRF